MECSDLIIRAIHPLIHIESMDAEEAAHFTCVRSAQADHPCATCLVYKADLNRLRVNFQPRLTAAMRSVLEKVRNAPTKSHAEDILRAHGLHDMSVSGFIYAMLDTR